MELAMGKTRKRLTAPALAEPLTPPQPPKAKPRTEDHDESPEVLDQLSPEEFARSFFGDGSPREAQEGLPSLEWLKPQFKTKSAAIRYLHSDLGGAHPPKTIAKHLGIRYQHARNVCTTPLKRGPNEDWRPKQPRKD